MIEPTTAGAALLPHLLAQGDEIISVVVLVIIAIISMVADAKRKRAAKSPNEIARKEKRQYDQAMADMQGQPQKTRAQVEYDQARARRLAIQQQRQALAEQKRMLRQQRKSQRQQTILNRPVAEVRQRVVLHAANAPAPKPSVAAKINTSYDRQLAERRARKRQQLKQSIAAHTGKKPAAAKKITMANAVQTPVTLSEIGAEQLPQKPSRAAIAQSAIDRRTAHLNDLQRGFIYHELFSAPRAIRDDVSIWDA